MVQALKRIESRRSRYQLRGRHLHGQAIILTAGAFLAGCATGFVISACIFMVSPLCNWLSQQSRNENYCFRPMFYLDIQTTTFVGRRETESILEYGGHVRNAQFNLAIPDFDEDSYVQLQRARRWSGETAEQWYGGRQWTTEMGFPFLAWMAVRPLSGGLRAGRITLDGGIYLTTGNASSLPLRPIWTGFVINSLVWSVPYWLAIILVRRRREMQSRRLGCCLCCGYQLTGCPGPTCPECGYSDGP
jgi:hypothetical protein